MTILHAIILSIVEGITEFLPISSTGHMILASKIMNIPQTDFATSFEIFIQLGAILAIVILYFHTLIRNIHVWKKVLAAFLPTAVIGFVLYKFIKHVLLGNPIITVWALLIGGIVLIALELFLKNKERTTGSIEGISYKQAVIIGLTQSLSVIPGVSRAAATIIGGSAVGLKRKTAVEFSFLLAVPTMLAASGLDIMKSNVAFTASEMWLLMVGFIGSCIVALIIVKFFLEYIKNHTFIAFGVYRIAIALAFLLFVIR
jgi:undecaprenyl-diphosphatase